MNHTIDHHHKIKIAYLAPEIPALSATFVYLEILELEKLGFEVLPISVHTPGSIAEEEMAKALSEKTEHLYQRPISQLIASFFSMVFKHPIRSICAVWMASFDALKMLPVNLRVSMGLLYRLLAAFEVAHILLKNECCHIHVHFAHIPCDIAMYAATIRGCPFSFTSHANDLFERGWLLKEKVRRSLFSVTISDHNRRFLMERGAISEKIHVIRCGVDASLFKAKQKENTSSIPQLGTLCRLVEKKGIDDLISACSRLKDEGVEFHLYIAGGGPLEQELIELKQKLDLEGCVSFIGPLAHDQVPDWISSLDLFVLPCKKDLNGDMDGIPVVLMEAMLVGTTVVSTTVSGIPELIDDGKSGFLCGPDDISDLTQTLKKALSEKEMRMRFYENAAEKIKRDFDLGKNVARLSGLLKKEIPCLQKENTIY